MFSVICLEKYSSATRILGVTFMSEDNNTCVLYDMSVVQYAYVSCRTYS